MILETTYLIAGEVFRPLNADDIGIRADWVGDITEAELNTDTLILSNRAKKIALDFLGQNGAFQGIPVIIQVGNTTLEYYIDFKNNPKLSGVGDSQIEVSIERRRSVKWFRNKINALSFEVINKTHPFDTIDAPYLIVPDNQAELLITLLISTFLLTKALIEGIKQLVESVANFIGTIFVGLGFNLGAFLSAALKLIANIIYVAALLIALIEMTKKILELIFPPIRKMKATRVRELLDKGCAKVGFKFSSTIIDEFEKLTILPVPLKKNNKSIFKNLISLNNQSYTKGYPTARDTTKTLGSLIDFLEDFAQAELRIIGDTVYLEEEDFWIDQSGLQIINTLNLQDVRENQYSLNTEEAWRRYILSWRHDTSDIHTMDNLDSLDVEYSTEAVNLNTADEDLFNVSGSVDINLRFALGNRKDSLTFVEKQTLPFAKLGDQVINFFGGNSNLVAKINGRIGNTQISQQYYNITKMLWATNGKQPADYLSKIGVKTIYERFHVKNQVKENAKRIFSARIPLSTAEFDMIMTNNYVFDELGDSLKLLTFDYINESKEAQIEYSVKSNEGDNTKTVLIDG